MSAPILRSIGGAPLVGERIVRHVYLDESGTGNPVREPYIVMAAVVAKPDKQWRQLSTYLVDMIHRYVPKEHRQDFSFHAVELFAGGKVFARDKENLQKWWPILDELLALVAKHELPIICGYLPRSWFLPGGDCFKLAAEAGTEPIIFGQVMTFLVTSLFLNNWIENYLEADEIAEMIMEQNSETRAIFKIVQRQMADPREQYLLPDKLAMRFRSVSRIKWPMYFEDKTESSILQLADPCAWAIRKHLSREPHSQRFFKPIEHLVWPRIPEKLDFSDVGASEGPQCA